MSKNRVAILELDLEHGIGQRLNNRSFELDGILALRHTHHFP